MADGKRHACAGKPSKTLGDCVLPANRERDGLWYCFQHDPVRLERKAETRRVERRLAEAKLEAAWQQANLERLSGIHELTNDDLERIVKAGGIRVFLPWHQNP